MKQQSISLKITDSSTYALARMKSYPVFQVHSVYRKTINLHAEGNLLAIQAQASPLSPVSLITNLNQSQMEKLPVCQGQFVYITDSNLIFCRQEISGKPEPLFAISYCDAKIRDLLLPAAFEGASSFYINQLRALLRKIICDAATGGIDLVFSESPLLHANLMMSAAKKRIDTASESLKKEDWSQASSELIRLIGLGIGLTPSGDDFTSGVLAGLILFGLSDHPFARYYLEDVSAHRYDTNDISRTFLTAAMDGHFSNAINTLARVKKEDLGGNISQTGDVLLQKFLAIGHSSGIDALCGIYFVLSNFC